MTHTNAIKLSKIFKLGNRIGLKKEEINDIIRNTKHVKILGLGAFPSTNSIDTYTSGGYYGTISIKHFHIEDL